MTSPNPNNDPVVVPHHDLNLSSASDFERIAEDGVEILCEPAHVKGLKRRDIASGDVADVAGLIRFVISPDGQVTPDLLQKLPGRGLWVKASRDSLDLAVKKNLFARAAKRQVKASADLSDTVCHLLRRRCLDLLGMARREGEIISGFEKVMAAIRSGKAAWLIEATDSADDGRSKILALARAMGAKAVGTGPSVSPKLCGLFSNDELSLALGLENAVHLALVNGKRIRRWKHEVTRLSGFTPLVPPGWNYTEGAQATAPD